MLDLPTTDDPDGPEETPGAAASETLSPAEEERILALAQERYARDWEAETDWRVQADQDERFLVPGHQWDEALRAAREAEQVPCLEENRTLQSVLLVTNDARQNRPGLTASAVDSAGDQRTADIVQGHFRHIEFDSDADTAYDAALWGGAVPGKGYCQVDAAFESPGSFDQKVVIRPVLNSHEVVMDCGAQLPTGADAGHVFRCRDLTWAAFEAEFGTSRTAALHTESPSSWATLGHAQMPDWVRADGIRIADYYTRDWVEATVSRMPVPPGTDKTRVQAAFPMAKSVVMGPEGANYADLLHVAPLPTDAPRPVKTRATRYAKVMHYKLAATEILDHTVWSENPECDPDGLLPIVRITGLRMQYDGKVDFVGLVRAERNPQELLNATMSSLAEVLGMAPKASYWVYEGQVTDPNFATINTRRHVAIETKAMPNGWRPEWGPAPIPQPSSREAPIQAIVQAMQIFGNGIDSTSGQYPAARGQRSNETSGVAIESRKEQSGVVAFHLIDNFHKMIRQVGKVVMAQIPQRYDTARTLRIIGADDTARQVQVNQPTMHGGEPAAFDLTAGRYDVVLSADPSYTTKKKQAAAQLPQVLQWIPAIGTDAPDLAVKSLPLVNGDELAARLKRGVQQRNPGVLGPEDKEQGAQEGPTPEMQKVQGEVQAAQTEIAALKSGEAIKRYEIDEQTKVKRYDIDKRYDIELRKLDTSMAETDATLGHAEQLAQTQAMIEFEEAEAAHARGMEKMSAAPPPQQQPGSPTGSPGGPPPTGPPPMAAGGGA